MNLTADELKALQELITFLLDNGEYYDRFGELGLGRQMNPIERSALEKLSAYL